MKFVGIGACVAVVGFCASSAQADDYYVSGALSGVFREPSTAATSQLVEVPGPAPGSFPDLFVNGQPTRFVSAIPARAHTDFRAGVETDVSLGRRFSLGAYGALRAEVEFSFRDYQVGTTTVTSQPGQPYTGILATTKTTSGLHEQRYAETANLFYDLTRLKGFTPYLGTGIGYQEGLQTSGERTSASPLGVGTAHYNSSSANDGTWFAEAGVAVPLTKRLSIAPAYRYSQAFAGNKPIHLMRVALRYSF